MRTYSYRAITLIVLFALAALGATAQTWVIGSELLNDRFGFWFGSPNLGYDPDEASRAIGELISVDGVDSVEVRVVQGNVTVAREVGGAIRIEGRASGSREFVDGLELQAELRGSTAVYDASYIAPGHTSQRGRTDMRVGVPDGVSVVVHNDAGQVIVSGIQDDVSVSTSMGTVRVSDTRGNLDVSTSAGTIAVESAVVAEHMTLSASMGDVEFSGELGQTNTIKVDAGLVRVAVPASTCVNVDAKVTAGRITSSLPLSGMTTGEMGASASGQLGTGTPTGTLAVEVSMGDITFGAQ